MTRVSLLLCAAICLAGCASDPLQDVPRLSETDVAESDIIAAIREEPANAPEDASARRGLFGRLFSNPTIAPEPTETEAASIETPEGTEAEALTTVEAPVPVVEAPAPRGGLLGFLRRAAEVAKQEDVQVAALAPEGAQDTAEAPARQLSINPNAPDARVVALGTALPWGQLARVCDVRAAQMGRRVERYPENRSMYAIYDSQPGNTEPHTFYVTGFKDGCARQFTAALALFGSTATHEQLRYGLPAKVQPYSQTDAAYEKLKSRVCRVGRGKPCGSALPKLSRNTVFVSVYENFGSNAEWKTILIHDGEVVETDIRDNG